MSDIRKIQTGNNQYTLHARVSDKLASVASYITRNQINYPWHRIATSGTLTVRNYDDFNVVLCITEHGDPHGFGIIQINLRKNNTNVSIAYATWLLRFKFNIDDIQLGLRNTADDTYLDVFIKLKSLWLGGVVYKINEGNRNVERDLYKFITSEEVQNTTATNKLTSYEVYKTIEEAATQLHGKAYTSIIKPTDSGTVANAGYAEKIGTDKSHPQIGSTTKPVFVDANGKILACSRDIPAVDTAMSATSTNPVLNKAVFEALKLKADTAALDKYQPKYKADYVATKDFNDSELPIDVNSVDLNGFTLNITKDSTLTKFFIINGTIAVADTCILTLAVDNCSNVIIKNIGTKEASIVIDKGNFNNCDFGCFAKINEGNKTSIIRNSTFRKDLNVLANCSILVYNTKFNGKIVINDTETIINAFGCILSEIPIIENEPMGKSSSHFFYCGCKDTIYLIGSFDLLGDFYDSGVDYGANKDSDLPISSRAVYNELKRKVGTYDLYEYVKLSYLEKNYNTGSYNSKTYVKRRDIYNIHVFRSSIANYSDLPGVNMIGDVYKIDNANIEHGIKAGDYVVWDGTTWYNMGSEVDESFYVTTNEMNKALGNKVDIVTGKGLSTNDYTTEEKNKLSKAFTKDTVTTEPGQFVAGPATTQGNLYLRKLTTSDIPWNEKFKVMTPAQYKTATKLTNVFYFILEE